MAKSAAKAKHVFKTHDVDCRHKNGVPHADDVTVKPTDEVFWSSSEGRSFTIHFEAGTPFADNTFTLPQRGSVSAGTVTGSEGRYKYSLKDDVGNVTDPTIIVQN